MIRYEPKYRVSGIRHEGQTSVGVRGPAGPGLEFTWDGTRLGVREQGQKEYQYVNLLGPEGKTGPEGKQGPKGATGEAFTYDDFTPEQLEALRGKEGAPGPDGKSLEFHWDSTRLGVRVEGGAYQYRDLQGPEGQPGTDGRNLEFIWNGTSLGVRQEGGNYQYRDLQGPEGKPGADGVPGQPGSNGAPGADGKSLEFSWDGTRLGVRVEGGAYQYRDLQGPEGKPGADGAPGPKGETGEGFAVLGYYQTASALETAVHDPDPGDAYGVGSADPYDIYIWDGVNREWKNNGPLQGAKGETGADGKSLEFTWSGTRLGVRQEGGSYQYVDLLGPAGADGVPGQPGSKGAPGADGKSLEFLWSGTQLGVRQEGGSYQYRDLRGPEGPAGADGQPGADGPAGAPGYTPQRGTDYWTAADIAEIKSYVDEAILGGAW